MRLTTTASVAIAAIVYAVVGTVPCAMAVTVPTAGSDSAAVPELAWQDCGDGFECATATVPLDYDKPGATITLPLIRRQATGPGHLIGSLFVNFGGPGESGVTTLRSAAGAGDFAALNERFDIVSFDPRGVGGASPAVRCLASSDIDAFLADFPDVVRDGLQRVIREAAVYARECRRQSGKILRHVSTADVARDLDLLRQAVGDEQLSYLGRSYGSEIGSQYVTLFPGRARAVALDSVIDHELWVNNPWGWELDRLRAFEASLQTFFAFCAGAAPEAAHLETVTPHVPTTSWWRATRRIRCPSRAA